MNNEHWLEHLKDSIPSTVSGDRLSIYAIALEGWRRGLTVNFYDFKYREKSIVRYSVSDDNKEVKFAYSTGPAVSDEAKKIAASKTKTKEYLRKSGVPVPKGKKFTHQFNDEVLEYVSKSLTYPIVLKPSGGKMGRGVIANIQNEKELQKSLIYVRERLGFKNIIVEEFIPGEEYRIYVINGKVIAAMNRIPANIIGDGKNSIRKLIAMKNKERNEVPSVRGRPIKIDSEVKRNIKRYNYDLNSILKKGEKLFLRKNSNISSGGDPIDVTDILPENVKEVAVMATQSVPDLVECGVDLIVDERDGVGRVIELNTSVGLAGHLFPLEGKPRDIPKAMIDYYFPNTEKITTNLYFDYTKITNPLKAGNLHEVVLPTLPKEEILMESLVITGKVQKVGFLSFVNRRATYCNLNGFVENRSDGSVFVVIAGTKRNIKEFKKLLSSTHPIRARIDNIEEKEWNSNMEVGFDIIREERSSTISSEHGKQIVKEKNVNSQALLMKNLELEKKVKKLEKKNKSYLESKSWKFTKPLRKISGRFKK